MGSQKIYNKLIVIINLLRISCDGQLVEYLNY